MVKLKDLIGPTLPSQIDIDRVHTAFLFALREKIKKVHLVRNLYFPGPGTRRPLYGLQWDVYIYIDAKSAKVAKILTIIHELVHFVFETTDSKRGEKKTRKAERRLFKMFSEEQKEALWNFIPKEVTLENVDSEGIN